MHRMLCGLVVAGTTLIAAGTVRAWVNDETLEKWSHAAVACGAGAFVIEEVGLSHLAPDMRYATMINFQRLGATEEQAIILGSEYMLGESVASEIDFGIEEVRRKLEGSQDVRTEYEVWAKQLFKECASGEHKKLGNR